MGTTNAANAVRAHNRPARLLITVLATLSLIATQLAVFAAQPAGADPGLYVPSPDVAPAYTGPATRYVVDGNPNCAALASTYGFEADGEIKFDRDPSPGASITSDGVTVTITARYTTRNGVPGLFFDYEVTGGVVEGALMKQGPGGLFYLYAPNGVTADQGLHSQERNGAIWAGVSHISFCYAKTPPPSTGQIALDKVDAEGRRLAGATLQLFEGSPGSMGAQVGTDCVTDGTSACTFAPLSLGTYTAVEAAAPDGYRLAGSTPRELTLTTSSADLTESWTFSNERIPYRISVDPDAVNPVGDPHEFTVLVEYQDEQGTWQPLPDADLTLGYAAVDGFSQAGSIMAVEAGTVMSATSASCTTADGTGALGAGSCVVTVNSGTPAKGELTATFATPYQHATSPTAVSDTTVGAAGVPGAIADTATKEWVDYGVDYGVDVTPDGVNPIGTADPDDSKHTFTVTVSRSASSLDAGSDRSGIVVDLVWQGDVGSIVEVDGTALDPGVAATTCVTDAAGTCTVVVDSDEVGSGSLVVMGLTDDGVSDDANDAAEVTFLAAEDLDGFVCPVEQDGVARICATKTWIAIELVKEATGGVELDGDTTYALVDPTADPADTEVLYTYWITNPGPDPLELTTLVDDKIGDISAAMIAAAEARYDGSTVMPVGDTLVVADVPYALTAEDLAAGEVENVAVVTGRSTVDPDVEVTAEDDEVVELRESLRPVISLVKTATDADVPFVRDAETGQLILFFDRTAGIDSAEVTYTYVITNIGDEPLVDLTLFDDKIGVLDASITVDRLDVGESTTVTATYTTTPEDLEAIFVTNVATTTGTGEDSGREVDDVDDETVEILEVFDVLQPRIQVVKDAVAGVTVGDNGRLEVVLADTETATVTYRYVVTNTGSDDLTDLTLVDDKIGDLTAELTAAVVAAYGEPVLPVTGSVTFTADQVVRVSDFDDGVLTNVVVVEGTGVETGTPVTDDDDETVVLIQVFDVVITTPTRPTSTSTPLPRTGLDAGLLTALGVALTMLGLAALLGTDRRRRRQE